MWDIILEIIRTVIIGAILFHLLMVGKREEIHQQEGWWYILAGFSLIFFGSALDLTDNFPSLNKFIIIGDTKVESFLEKVFGYLLGSLLLAIGFWKWMPTIIALGETKKKLKESYNELESKVEERTFHLKELNEQLREEITKRKISDERFWESEDRYLNLIENVSDVIYTLDKNGAITSLNLAFEKITGWLRVEWLGKSFRGLIHPDDFPNAMKEFQKVLEGETPPLKEFRILSKSGDYLFGEFTGSPLIKNGKIEGVLGTARDITERKKAEEELRGSEKKYKSLYRMMRLMCDNVPDLIWAKDLGKRFIFTNRAICEKLLNAKDTDEPIGKTDMYFAERERKAHPENPLWHDFGEICTDSDSVVIKTKKPQRFDEFGNAIGKYFYLDVHKAPFWDEQGNMIGTVGCGRDVTKEKQIEEERSRAEEALRESEEKYRTVLENIEDGYYEVDLAGNFTFFNDSTCRILGYSREELMGMNNRQYTDAENSKKLYQAFNKVYQTGKPAKEFDWEVIRKDGTRRIGEVSISLIKNAVGQLFGFRGIARDITERKRVEQEMFALQEQLRQSQKMEAIGRLAGGIAHDFNNLLTIIKGYSQLSLIDLKEGDPLKGNIVEIQKASERAADLTRQLLAFGRRQVMEMKVLDLNALLINMEKMLRRVIGENIDLVTVLADDLGRVKADPGQIENVIINLAVNARDAMPSGGKLTIETSNVELDEAYVRSHVGVKPGRYVMFSVSDTGVGMTPEVKERIFEPFFTTKEKDKGTGLGSSTVYGIVRQSGGNIWVYSEPGGGTTFKIYLPRIDEPLEEMKKSVAREVIPHGNETILVVEDEEEVRNLTVQILIKNGYKVLEASNGREALYVCEQHRDPIHLVVTDVVMPEMSGPELAKYLSSLRPEMKVLYMSGYTDSAIIRNGVLEPGTPFFQKPFTPDTLARKVRDVLDS